MPTGCARLTAGSKIMRLAIIARKLDGSHREPIAHEPSD
ncbi:hypothetical protein CFU_1113 [Collimonas fungivorans Ter331]|uniref:Uncharacterized protein n=1 Tax=Collimonas fungivorans (strain Ter331) TaxID=1005048 RepID=G0AJ12_COLFT|nr:hypothetical protein CFU_1113 [Collimonas fungivorans Ter331]